MSSGNLRIAEAEQQSRLDGTHPDLIVTDARLEYQTLGSGH
jgi:hypothetical protein